MLKIGEFANLFNVSIKTVRFYEEKELFKMFYFWRNENKKEPW